MFYRNRMCGICIGATRGGDAKVSLAPLVIFRFKYSKIPSILRS